MSVQVKASELRAGQNIRVNGVWEKVVSVTREEHGLVVTHTGDCSNIGLHDFIRLFDHETVTVEG